MIATSNTVCLEVFVLLRVFLFPQNFYPSTSTLLPSCTTALSILLFYSLLVHYAPRVPGTLLISPFPGEHLWLFIPLCLSIFSSLCLECPSLMLGNSCFLFGSPNAIFCEADFHFLLWASRILYTCLFCRPYYIVLTWFVCISLYSTELWLFEGKDHKMLRVFKKLLNEQMLLNQLKRISVMVLGRHTRARHPSKSVYTFLCLPPARRDSEDNLITWKIFILLSVFLILGSMS